jgi:hypothetical protein
MLSFQAISSSSYLIPGSLISLITRPVLRDCNRLLTTLPSPTSQAPLPPPSELKKSEFSAHPVQPPPPSELTKTTSSKRVVELIHKKPPQERAPRGLYARPETLPPTIAQAGLKHIG